MPIGVPKVLFVLPQDDNEEDSQPEPASWVDVYNRLYRERFLFLGQEAEPEPSNQVMGLMISLTIEDPTRELFLFINSPGGGVISGLGIFDTMQMVPQDVHTVCIGLAASVASFILVGGSKPKRIAYPHSRVMIHQPASSFFESPLGEFIVDSDELLKIREMMGDVYEELTGTPLWALSEDMERDVFLSPKEAQTHGIVDRVGFPDFSFKV
uniref:ATP-dependent Clp protease proteolytic subunit n=1 Tax=Diptychocarpus strictus TaxID=359840 RepID=A0A6M8YSM9_9BRAS|nr:ATP-dependent protease subunit [Diptychocarpus strictus]QKK41975.1 ATP-dependent protease subunit [Diptychocarpus strictus]